MISEKMAAACLAATLATAWMAPSSAEAATEGTVTFSTTVYVRSITSLTYLYDSVRVIGMGSGSGGGYDYVDGGPIQGGTQDRSFILNGGSPPERFAAIGFGSGPDIYITTDRPSIAVGREFDDVFDIPPGGGSNGFDFNEAQLAADLRSGLPTAALNAFVARLHQLDFTAPFDAECVNVHYSIGVEVGSFQFSAAPIPEPGSASGILLGAGLLYRRRKP